MHPFIWCGSGVVPCVQNVRRNSRTPFVHAHEKAVREDKGNTWRPESGLEGDGSTRDATVHDDLWVELAAGGLGSADGLVSGDESRLS